MAAVYDWVMTPCYCHYCCYHYYCCNIIIVIVIVCDRKLSRRRSQLPVKKGWSPSQSVWVTGGPTSAVSPQTHPWRQSTGSRPWITITVIITIVITIIINIVITIFIIVIIILSPG
jgi:hypothetical protein